MSKKKIMKTQQPYEAKDPKTRAVLALLLDLDWSYDDIQKAMDITPDELKHLIVSQMKQLRGDLEYLALIVQRRESSRIRLSNDNNG